jgi:bacterioferritin-associated ferredoxin
MYICVCNAVTETDIKKAVKNGVNCMQHLETKLGVSNQCGSCLCDASNCLDRAIESELSSANLIAI